MNPAEGPGDARGSGAEAAARFHDHPVEYVSPDDRVRVPEEGVALCLSGGGFRAMLFHAGALLRLGELGLLPKLARVSSVSAGSITAGVLALAWDRLDRSGGERTAAGLRSLVIAPVRALARRTLDVPAALLGLCAPGNASSWLAGALSRHLFGERTLSDLPDEPEFVFNATSVTTGDLFLLRKRRSGDYKVGEFEFADLRISQAVAASAAFPPFLSPARFSLGGAQDVDRPLNRPPYTDRAVLTDGGVYDNLGIEAAWKNYRTILVSDGGSEMEPDPAPKSDWPRQMIRVVEVIDHQVRTMRKRLLVGHFIRGTRDGAYWSIRGDIRDYGAVSRLDCPVDRTLGLARIPTRMKRLDDRTQERLINWGYALTDAAVRRFVAPDLAPPAGFPFERSGV